MTDAELIARLRDRTVFGTPTAIAAADRIEELKAVIDHQHKRAETLAEGWRIADDARIELEAKLAKAVEALDKIAGVNGPYSHPFPEDSEGYGAFAVVKSREALGELGVTKWTMKI